MRYAKTANAGHSAKRATQDMMMEVKAMLMRKWVAAAAVSLLSTSGAIAQMRPEVRAVLQACKPDIARFCSQVPPGQGRVKACMKEHIRELSEPCKEGLFQAWLRQ
jgi:hypothetical protein